MKGRAVENEVLSVYQRISPSALPIEEREMFEAVSRRLKNIYFHRLKFPLRFFDGLSYANFGCGSGEQDMVLASWGGRGVGIDLNPISIARANKLKDRFGFDDRLRFIESNVLEPELPEDSYDLVLSDGVIPHVENPRGFLKQMASRVAPGGFLLLGYLDQAGNMQRLLHGVVTRMMVEDEADFEKVEKVAYALFKDHLDRCAHYGGRTVQAVINDYIINKHSYGIDTVEIISLMKEQGFSIHSGYPLNTSFINSSPSDQYNSEEMSDSGYWQLQQLAWMFARDHNEWISPEDVKEIWLGDLDELILSKATQKESDKLMGGFRYKVELFRKGLEQLLETNIEVGITELHDLMSNLSRITEEGVDALPQSLYERLFRGFNGFGTCYLSFYREE